MKNSILTFALMTVFGAFIFASNSTSDVSNTNTIVCEGEHKCDDKCKKDKEGKCAEASAESADGEDKKACCSKKSKKSCHGKKSKSEDKSGEDSDTKS